MTNPIISDEALGIIFRNARSFDEYTDKPVSDVTLRAAYDLYRYGPTSANCSPTRIIFLKSDAAKERLRPCLSDINVDKVLAAPVTALISYDTQFYELLPQLFPSQPTARSWFDGDVDVANITAFRNGTLQGAYFIIAARAVGLDCGPMSGFDNAAADAEFHPEGQIKSNFLCTLGYGDPTNLIERSPRPDFDQICEIS